MIDNSGSDEYFINNTWQIVIQEQCRVGQEVWYIVEKITNHQ